MPWLRFKCSICLKKKSVLKAFHLAICKHCFCLGCASRYAQAQVELGRIHIPCPALGCGKLFLFKECEKLLDSRSINILKARAKECEIPVANRIYCTYKDCWGLMDSRELELEVGMHAQVQCASCLRSFSYTYVGGEFDQQLMKLAKSRKWKQCPMCKHMVERRDGCSVIGCRCGSTFCYRCGKVLKWSFGILLQSHVCI